MGRLQGGYRRRAGRPVAETSRRLRLEAWCLLGIAGGLVVLGLMIMFWFDTPVVGLAVALGGSLVVSTARSRFRRAR